MILNLYLVVLLTGITLLARISSKVRVLVLPAPIESMEGPRKPPPNCRAFSCDRRPPENFAAGPPERLMRPEGTVVLGRRTVLRSSIPWVRLAATPR